MKTTFLILIIFISTTSCNFRSEPLNLDKIREDFARDAEISNAKILRWENLMDSIYNISKISYLSGHELIDKLIKSDRSLDEFQISRLHFIKGDLYYSQDSSQEAIDEFTLAGKVTKMNAPKYLAARAGAYIKLQQFDKAYADLNKAAGINHDYLWSIGNYHEILGNKDSALIYYNRLYMEDTVIYKKCSDRISELKNPKTKLLTELIYTDRNTGVILIHGVK
jgi:tetratricopeptide (TPR) repeat protein